MILALLAACHGPTARGDDPVASLELWPDGVVVAAGATVPLRAVAVHESGVREDVAATFVSKTDAVAAVDGERATALSAGDATLKAKWEGLEAEATLTVGSGRRVRVVAVDAESGAPLADALVFAPDGWSVADASGAVTIAEPDPVLPWVTIFADDHVPTSVLGVGVREAVVPVRSAAAASALLTGEADLSGVPAPGVGQAVVGVAAGSLGRDLGFYDPARLFGPERTVDVAGFDLEIPANVYASYETSLTVEADEGAPVWTFAGPVDVTALAGVETPDDASDLLADWLPGFAWDVAEGADVAPSEPIDGEVAATVPSTALGTPTLLLVDQDGVVAGLGRGSGDVDVAAVPADVLGWPDEGRVVGVAVDGGVGGDVDRYALVVGPVVDGAVALPDWPDVPVLGAWAGDVLPVDVDGSADAVRVEITDDDGRVRDVWLPPGTDADVAPEGLPLAVGDRYRVTAVATDRDTWDGLVAGHLGEVGRWTRSSGTAVTVR